VVVRVPPSQAAPADEGSIEKTVHGQPRPGALVRHLSAGREEVLGAPTLAPGRRVPVAQHVGVAVQREEGVSVRLGEGTQPQAFGVQRGGGY
jgi:hypothetical protein